MDPALSVHVNCSLTGADQSLYGLATARALVVPVGRVPAAAFQRYRGILMRYGHAIAHSELNVATAVAPAQNPHGQVLFNFAAHHNAADEPWEEFQVHRQPLVVIGIIHCPSVDMDLATAYQTHFQPLQKKYPTALVSRCFAFEPADALVDNTKGVVVIPNQSSDQIAFYLHTLMADVASDLVGSLGTLIAATEKKTSVVSPNSGGSSTGGPAANTAGTSVVASSYNLEASTGETSIIASNVPTKTAPQTSHIASPGLPPEKPLPPPNKDNATSVSSSVETLPESVTASAESIGTTDISESTFAAPVDVTLQPGGGALPPTTRDKSPARSLASHSNLSSAATAGGTKKRKPFFQLAQAIQAVSSPSTASTPSNANPFASMADSATTGISEMIVRDKKKTPGRVQKLIGDLYLVSGMWSNAASAYAQAIELSRPGNDSLWLAGALEAKFCAAVLVAIANARDSGDHKDIIALIKGAPTVFSEVLVHYEKAGAHLLRVGACVRIARWLTEVWCGIYHPLPDSHPFAKYQNESEQVADGTESSTSSKASLLEDAERERVCIQLPKTASNSAIFIAKADAAFWTMRIWDSGLEHLSLQEQIHMASAMATNFGAIGYHRKYAFFLRQTALLMLPFVTRGLDSTSAEVSNVIDPTVRLYDLGIHAGDSEMAIMCLVIASIGYGVVSGSVASSTAINQFLLGIVPPKPLATDKNRNRGRYGATAFGGVLGDGHRLGSGFGYGWFDLQIDVLKEGVAFAERLKDHRRSAIFLSALITRMHMFLSRSDQHRMISALKRLSLKLTALAPTTFVPSLPPVVQFLDVPRFASFRPLHRFAVLKRIMVASNADGKRSPPTLHVLKPVVASGDGTAAIVSADPFIYNPNDAKAKKGAAGARRKSKARHMVGHSDDDEEELAITAACTIVEGETARFLVVLDNPFLIDLEVENVSLIVSGMELQDAQIDKGMSERILLRARPKTVGDHGDQHHQSSKTEVCISGIPVKNGTLSIHGCLVQFGNGWVEEWLVGRTGRMLRRETTAAELTPFTSADQLTADNTHKMEVVVAPRQPLLKVKHTAKMHQLDMTLFEGEKRSLKLTVDNIGLDVARHVRVVCKERIESLPQDMVLDAEALYERECYERTYHALRWKEAGTEKAIACGKSRIVEIDVFGKKGCTGGTIEIEYGARALSDGIAHAEGAPTAAPFYVRRLVISLNVTVHRVLLPIYMDVLPFWFSDEMSKDADAKRRLSVEEMVLDTPQLNGTAEDPLDDGSDYCLFTVDIRNSWNYPFDVSFLLRAPASIASVSSDPRDLPPTTDGDNALTATAPTTINPAQTKRIAIPIPKLQLESFLKELAMESRSATAAAHHFVFPTGPTNLVPDVPAVPVLKDRQFVLPQDGVAKNFAIIQSKVKKMRKERRSKRSAAQRKYGPAQYWLAGGESADANKAPTAEKEVDRHCWWYRDSSDDEEEERLQEDLNAAQTQLLGQAASDAPSFHLKEYRAAMEQAVDNERWSRLMFLYRDQLFRRCVAGIRWSCDENVYSEAKVAGTRSGLLDLRSEMRLTRGMVLNLKRYEVDINVAVVGNPLPVRKSRSHWVFKLGDDAAAPCRVPEASLIFRLEAEASKHSVADKKYILRLLPIQDTSESEGTVVFDLRGKLMWSGALQSVITPATTIGGDSTSSHDHAVPFFFHSVGVYKFLWHVEEVTEPWHVHERDFRWMDRRSELQWCSEPIVVEVV